MSRLYIDKDTLMMAINANLVYWGGGTFGRIVFNMLIETNINYDDYEAPRFFQPYKTREDYLNIYSPITAPITFLLLAAEMALGFVVSVINALYSSFTFNWEEAKEEVANVGKTLLNTIVFLAAAVISPIVSLVDVIGSGINTVIDSCKEDPSERFYMN